MANIKTIKTIKGKIIEYSLIPEMETGMSRVYITTDKKQTVTFYKNKPSAEERERIYEIVYKYNPCKDASNYGDYWKNLFCWPSDIFNVENFGIVVSAFQKHFFFEADTMKRKEKEGKLFASAKARKLLDPSEKGIWLNYFQICILICWAVRRMHTSGLAHADLSYKNVLIDLKGLRAAIIIFTDNLILLESCPPVILGTPDFIAPGLFSTLHLDLIDRNRKLPSMATDFHVLAVLICIYLLCRHPLRGRKVHDLDPNKDEVLSMGEKALFIEHPQDKNNRPREQHPAYMPWSDIYKLPYTICGPYLKELFEQVFIKGLHEPNLRPTANQWESALIKTVDLMQPCGNPKCEQKWFAFDNTTKLTCPFCGWKFKGELPIINFYSLRKQGHFSPDDIRLMAYHNQ